MRRNPSRPIQDCYYGSGILTEHRQQVQEQWLGFSALDRYGKSSTVHNADFADRLSGSSPKTSIF